MTWHLPNNSPAVVRPISSPSRSTPAASGQHIRFEGSSVNSSMTITIPSAPPLLSPSGSPMVAGEEASAGMSPVGVGGSSNSVGAEAASMMVPLTITSIMDAASGAPIQGIMSTPEKAQKRGHRRVSFAEGAAAPPTNSRKGRAVPRLKKRGEGGGGVRSRWGRRGKGRPKQEEKVPLTLFAVGATMVFVQKLKAIGVRWQKEQQRIAAMPRAAFVIQCAMRRVWAEDRLRVVRAQCFLVHWISFRYRQWRKAKGRSALFLQRFFRGGRDRSFVQFMHFRMRMNAALEVLRGYVQRWEAQNLLSRLRDQRDERNEVFQRCKLASLRLLRDERVEWIQLVQQARDTLGVCPLLPTQEWASAVEECSGVNPLELLDIRPFSPQKSTNHLPMCPIFLRRISSTSLLMASSSNPPIVTATMMRQISSPSLSTGEGSSSSPPSLQCRLSDLSFRVNAGKPAYLKTVPYTSVVQSLNSSQHLPNLEVSSPDTSLTGSGVSKDLTTYERSNAAIVSANQTFVQTAAAADARLLQLYQRTSQKRKGLSKAIPLFQQLSSIAKDAHRFTEKLFVWETPSYLDDLFDLALIRRLGGISNCSSMQSVNTRGGELRESDGRHPYSVSTKSMNDGRSITPAMLVSESTLSIEDHSGSSSSSQQQRPRSLSSGKDAANASQGEGGTDEEDGGGGGGGTRGRALIQHQPLPSGEDECRWGSQSDNSVPTLPATPSAKMDGSANYFPPYSPPQIKLLKPPVPPLIATSSPPPQSGRSDATGDAEVFRAFIQLLETTESVERKALQRQLWEAHRNLTLPFCLLSYTITLSRTVPPLFSGLLIDMMDAEFMEKAAALFNMEREARLKLLEEYSNVPLQHLSRPSLHPGPEVRVRKMVRRAMAMPDPLEQARHSIAAVEQLSFSTQGFVDGKTEVLLSAPHHRRLTSTVSIDVVGSGSDSEVVVQTPVDVNSVQQQSGGIPGASASGTGAPKKKKLKVSMAPVVQRRRPRGESVVSSSLGGDERMRSGSRSLPSNGFPLPILLAPTPAESVVFSSKGTLSSIDTFPSARREMMLMLSEELGDGSSSGGGRGGELTLTGYDARPKDAATDLLEDDIAKMHELPVLVVRRSVKEPQRPTTSAPEDAMGRPASGQAMSPSSVLLSSLSTNSLSPSASSPLTTVGASYASPRPCSSVSRTQYSSCRISPSAASSPASLPPLPHRCHSGCGGSIQERGVDRRTSSLPGASASPCETLMMDNSCRPPSSAASESLTPPHRSGSRSSSANSLSSLSWPSTSVSSSESSIVLSSDRKQPPPPPPRKKAEPPAPPPRKQHQRLSVASSLTLYQSSSFSMDVTGSGGTVGVTGSGAGNNGSISVASKRVSSAGGAVTTCVAQPSSMSRGSDQSNYVTPLVKQFVFSEPERFTSWSVGSGRTEDERSSFASGSLMNPSIMNTTTGETGTDEHTIMNGRIPVGSPEDMNDLDDGEDDVFGGDQVIVTREFNL